MFWLLLPFWPCDDKKRRKKKKKTKKEMKKNNEEQQGTTSCCCSEVTGRSMWESTLVLDEEKKTMSLVGGSFRFGFVEIFFLKVS